MSGRCDAIDAEFSVGAVAGVVVDRVAEVVVFSAAGEVVLAGAAGAVGCYKGSRGRAGVDDAGVGHWGALGLTRYADGSAGVEGGNGDGGCAVSDTI